MKYLIDSVYFPPDIPETKVIRIFFDLLGKMEGYCEILTEEIKNIAGKGIKHSTHL